MFNHNLYFLIVLWLLRLWKIILNYISYLRKRIRLKNQVFSCKWSLLQLDIKRLTYALKFNLWITRQDAKIKVDQGFIKWNLTRLWMWNSAMILSLFSYRSRSSSHRYLCCSCIELVIIKGLKTFKNTASQDDQANLRKKRLLNLDKYQIEGH